MKTLKIVLAGLLALIVSSPLMAETEQAKTDLTALAQELRPEQAADPSITNPIPPEPSLGHLLTESERAFLAGSPQFTVCVRQQQYPITGEKEGELVGIAGSIAKNLFEQLNLNYKVVTAPDKDTEYQMITTGACDLVASVRAGNTLFEGLSASSPIFTTAFTSIGNINSFYIDDYTNFDGHTFYVQETLHKQIFSEYYPELLVKVEPDLDRIMSILADDDNSHYLNVGLVNEYLINMYGIDRYKMNGRFDKLRVAGALGVHDSQPTLLSIINKALSTLTQDDLKRFISDYRPSIVKVYDYRSLWFAITIGLAAVLFLLYRNRLLKTKSRQIEQINQNLQAAQQAAHQANQSKSRFLANMSHEIRTPMNSVLGIAQLMARPGRHSAEVTEQAAKIVRAGQSLQSILNDILDFSKIESGKLTLNPATVSLSELLENLAMIMGSSAREKQIELAIKSSLPNEFRFVADPLRLEQVLINLIGNAIKFTEAGYVSLEVEPVPGPQEPARLRFRVRDTGVGISEAAQKTILEPFSQADDTITRRFGGSGLGLAITNTMLNLMDSELHLESRLGKGSTFSFELPVVCPEDEPLPAPVKEAPLSVLIADDQEITLDSMGCAASVIGWQPIYAKNGQQAVDCYRQALARGEAPQLILMDWLMPDIDGLEVSRQIKQISEDAGEQNPPVVVMVTAYSREQLLSNPNAAYADLVLNKPITIAGLLNAYRSLRSDAGPHEPNDDQHSAAPRLRGVRILAVDDNLDNRDVARMIFESEGAEVFLAENGQEALDWLAEHEGGVDAVLMDVQMPVLDGLEATRLIRVDARFKDLPIIGMSGGGYESDFQNALQAGMNSYITKPVNVSLAIDTLESLLTEQRSGTFGSDFTTATRQTEAPQPLEALPLFDERSALAFWKDVSKIAFYFAQFRQEFTATLDSAQTEPLPTPALLHKIKGAAGAIYLNRLQAALQQAETAANQGEAVHTALKTLSAVWAETQPIMAGFEQQHGAAPSRVDPAEAAPSIPEAQLRALLHAIESYNPDQASEALQPLLLAYPSADLSAAQAAVDRFDFKSASQRVKALMKE